MDFRDHLVRIEAKIDKQGDKLSAIDSTLAAQHVSLKEHIRRTALLEAKVEPIQKHVAMVSGALKLIGLIATMAGLLEALITILSLIKG